VIEQQFTEEQSNCTKKDTEELPELLLNLTLRNCKKWAS